MTVDEWILRTLTAGIEVRGTGGITWPVLIQLELPEVISRPRLKALHASNFCKVLAGC